MCLANVVSRCSLTLAPSQALACVIYLWLFLLFFSFEKKMYKTHKVSYWNNHLLNNPSPLINAILRDIEL